MDGEGDQGEQPAEEYTATVAELQLELRSVGYHCPCFSHHSMLPVQKWEIHATNALIFPCIPRSHPLPPRALFLFSSLSQVSFIQHRRLEHWALDYLVSLVGSLETTMLPNIFKKKKKETHALASSHQRPGNLPAHYPHSIGFPQNNTGPW